MAPNLAPFFQPGWTQSIFPNADKNSLSKLSPTLNPKSFALSSSYFASCDFKEEKRYSSIGSYWERGNKNEIDIVAIDELDKRVLIGEVKVSKRKLDTEVLITKSQKLVSEYTGYEVEYRVFCLEDLL